MSKKLTTKQIDAALYAIDHAEADADCDGFADRERSRELRMGVMVLRRLLAEAVGKTQER